MAGLHDVVQTFRQHLEELELHGGDAAAGESAAAAMEELA
jgi:hypothetical protein